ncbi:MAG: alpha-amylase [Anaerolineae bacterium]|nr:alpha-amylase [Anaerolineae bacterium]
MRKRVTIALLLVVAALAGCRTGPRALPITPPPSPGEGDVQWWNERIFYEVFVRSFQDSDGDGIGDLAGLIERLDYLNDGDPKTSDDLGVTGLWLMPVTESPSYHGYDVTDYYAVETDYGDAATFRQLVDEAHERGIVVIVDLVINHTSNQHPWFRDAATGPDAGYRDWYVWSDEKQSYFGPWGQAVWYPRGDAYYYAIFWDGMPDLNYRTPAVTDEIYEVTRFWLQDMGVDGFRMDAVRHLIEDGAQQENTPETHDWLEAWHDHYKGIRPHALSVGEVWTRSEDVVPYVGDELDICFEFDLASAILDGVRGGTTSMVTSIAQKVERLYPDQQYATFLTNHDHERVMSQVRGDETKAKTAAAIYLTLPGVPFLYYGEEIGMSGEKPDENIRRPMQWSGEEHAGFSTAVPWQGVNPDYRTRNVADQAGDDGSLLNTYRRLIRARSAYGALRTGSLIPVLSGSIHVFAYIRHGASEDVLVVHNLGEEPVSEYRLNVRASDLAPGRYRMRDLLSGERAPELMVAEGGTFADYVPWPTLAPGQSLLLLMDR